ncbi:MAG TPA: DctP family TRAP transporter solute-binding subunit [Clostridia bacterium]|nr:DctP family TRAP transporter solute-binding subunit [Clostridia bacterium]
MTRKLAVLLTVVLVVALFGGGCGGGGSDQPGKTVEGEEKQEYLVRFAHEEIPGSVQDLYAQKFKEVLEKKSDGKIKVEIYPIGQLGDATQQCELLQTGGLEFAIISPGNTGTIVPENQLFSLHFLLSDDMNINKRIMKESRALNDMLSKLYLEKNIKVLAYWTEGFQQWTGNKPLRSPEDFKGFKMRTMPSPMIVAAYEAYGANPTPMPYLEVYSGLQLNMIDGQENPIFAVEEMKFYEVQKALVLANACLYVTTTSVNPDFFNSLPDDLQQAVLDTAEELRDYSFDIQQKLNDERLGRIKEVSDIEIIELSNEEREALRQASMSARDRYVSMVGSKGKEILDLLVKEVEQIEKGK